MGPDGAAAVVSGGSALQDARDGLARWARSVTSAATRTIPQQVAALRAAGLDEDQFFTATVLIALRLAFATVNDALGAAPDEELRAAVPDALRRAVVDRLG